MTARDMTTPEIVRIVGKRADTAQKNTGAVIVAYQKFLAEQLVKGSAVVLTGLGTLSIRTMAARSGVNPATGEKVKYAARKKLAFKPSPGIKKAINHED